MKIEQVCNILCMFFDKLRMKIYSQTDIKLKKGIHIGPLLKQKKVEKV